MKKIDFEFHYCRPELFKYMASRSKTGVFEVRKGVTGNLGIVTNTYPIVDELFEIGERRIADMDRCGIDVGVLSSSPAQEELPKAESVRLSKLANDAVAEACRRHPGRFAGAATLPTLYVDEAIAELERCVKELGFKYWHTHSNYGSEHLYDVRFLPLLAKCEELGCAFYLHPQCSEDADMCDLGFAYAGPGLGYGLDTMRTSLRLMLNGTFDRFPKLRMILGHMGEYYPFILDRIDNRFAWMPDPRVKMKNPVSYYFKNRNIIMTSSGMASRDAFLLTKKVIGIDGILFASDYPFENLKHATDAWNEILADQTEEDRDKFWHGNAERYGLV